MEWLNISIAEIVKWLLHRVGMKSHYSKEGLEQYRRAREESRRARLASYEDEREHAEHLARIAIRQAIRLGLPDKQEWFYAAKLAEELGEFESAVRAFQKVARGRSRLALEATVGLAEMWARQGRSTEAKELAVRVLKSYPDPCEAKELLELLRELCLGENR